jgi:hypothetical protein
VTDAEREYSVIEISLESIRLPETTRELRNLNSLKQSIQQVGLIQPITVVDHGDGTFALVAGHRRTAVFRDLGHTHIPAIKRSLTEADAQLATLDENLEQDALTSLERNEWLAEKQAWYEARYPETKKGTVGLDTINQNERSLVLDRAAPFREIESAKQGIAPDELNRWIKAARDISPEAKGIIKTSPEVANNNRALIEVARLPAEDQVDAAKKLVTKEATAKSLEAARRKSEPKKRQAKQVAKDGPGNAPANSDFVESDSYACQSERHTIASLKEKHTRHDRVILTTDISMSSDKIARYYDRNEVTQFINAWSRFWPTPLLDDVIDLLNRKRTSR